MFTIGVEAYTKTEQGGIWIGTVQGGYEDRFTGERFICLQSISGQIFFQPVDKIMNIRECYARANGTQKVLKTLQPSQPAGREQMVHRTVETSGDKKHSYASAELFAPIPAKTD